METRRWTNPSQPQTLYLAVILLYINAALGLIGALFGFGLGLLGLLLIVGAVSAGLGIANEKRWGYVLGVALASLSLFLAVVLPLIVEGPLLVFDPFFLINAVFPVALFALLVHPMSREYQRIWFK
jgi:hypothetical protein